MSVNPNEVQVGAQGRVVIPAALRKAMNLKPGERLVARVEGNRLILEHRKEARREQAQMEKSSK
ncbi:AbrB/MazE/SpoVT family DNA-binding domain-containing protein [Thiolapillus sp.]